MQRSVARSHRLDPNWPSHCSDGARELWLGEFCAFLFAESAARDGVSRSRLDLRARVGGEFRQAAVFSDIFFVNPSLKEFHGNCVRLIPARFASTTKVCA